MEELKEQQGLEKGNKEKESRGVLVLVLVIIIAVVGFVVHQLSTRKKKNS